MRARAHNRPTFARGSGPGLGFIAVASKTVHFATVCMHARSDGSEFYVAMDLDLADEFEAAPNGRHNLFKCSMCDIFRIVRNMLPPQPPNLSLIHI